MIDAATRGFLGIWVIFSSVSWGVAGCGGGGDDDALPPLPPLTSATSLDCPRPGALPFRTADYGFADPTNATLASQDPRVKDAASDSLGATDGPAANTFLADDANAAVGPTAYAGVKARTTPASGLSEQILAGEPVSLWTYQDGGWVQLARTDTDEDGAYAEQLAAIVPNDQPVYSMLEGDLSCAVHYDERIAAGTKVIVTDIDGTLTTSDDEFVTQVGDEAYDPVMVAAAAALMTRWEAKGYPVIYVTARAHLFRTETRAWLTAHGFPAGPVVTSNSTHAADVYKTAWLERMTGAFGWRIEAAYGNADTDITAYETDGIAKDHTFIVGPLAGTRGTVPIANLDFSAHLAGFVAGEPDQH